MVASGRLLLFKIAPGVFEQPPRPGSTVGAPGEARARRDSGALLDCRSTAVPGALHHSRSPCACRPHGRARFERWARGRLAEGFSQDAAAPELAPSRRTLQRRLAEVLGKSPLSYFQDLRVEHALHLLRTSHANIEAIAAVVGYGDGVILRALLRRRLGRGVRELRRP